MARLESVNIDSQSGKPVGGRLELCQPFIEVNAMNAMNIDMRSYRQPEFPVQEILVHRWSPRAMSGQPISLEELNTLFEAARWAPSSYNEQPWRFTYAMRDTEAWPFYLSWLMETNRSWCVHAAALILIVSKKTFSHNGKPNAVHLFDAGAAWENLAIQGVRMGLVVHAMAGFDGNKATQGANIPADYSVCTMVAVGRPGEVEALPEPLRSREIPSGRKSISQLAFEARFPGSLTEL